MSDDTPEAVVESPAATPSIPKRRPRKPAKVDENLARYQAALAEALVQAQAIQYPPPPVPLPALGKKAGKTEKAGRTKKSKLVRDSYAMPAPEYAQLGGLKSRLAALGREVKKSELLRGGIALLASLGDDELQTVMARVERIKTGRPAK